MAKAKKAATTLVRIGEAQLEKLRALKAQTKVPMRHIVEMALAQYLAKPGSR